MNQNFNQNYPFCRVIIDPNRSIKTLIAKQVAIDEKNTPLLPPDEIIDSHDNSVDGSQRSSSYIDITRARDAYQRLQKGKQSVNRHRKFVFGAIYKNLFPGYFQIDPLQGDVDVTVTLPLKEESTIRIRLISPHQGLNEQQLLSSIVGFGKTLSGTGNARGAKVGDLGSMHAFGIRSRSTKEIFKGTAEHADKIKITSSLMRDWMEENMQETLKKILNQDKDNGTSDIISCMPRGPGSRVMISVNLANSAHFDIGDTSESIGVWVEMKPGQAKNWYFVLPNITCQGSAGLIVKLCHGVAIVWDGRKIYHCTSKTECGIDNKVYGCMWGSSR